MKITGLTRQWGDRLFSSFDPDPDSDIRFQLRDRSIQHLLIFLSTIEGPDLWVGTSHSLLNFCARDTTHEWDDVPSLAYVEAYASGYSIRYPVPREIRPCEDAMMALHAVDVRQAASMLLMAIESSDHNPVRIRSNWMWYVCPECDFHSPNYAANCERCGYAFPSELKSQAIGIYRAVRVSKGTAVPSKAIGWPWQL